MKKLIAGISVLAIAGFVSLASAEEGDWWGGDHWSRVIIENNNTANIETNAWSVSNTGANSADADSGDQMDWPWVLRTEGGEGSGGSSRAAGGMIETGDAAAGTAVGIVANSNDISVDQSGCGCVMDGDVHLKTRISNNNTANIDTTAVSIANSGFNSADASSDSDEGSSRARGGHIMTGNATAVTEVGIVANTNIISVQH